MCGEQAPWHWVGCPDVRPLASPLLRAAQLLRMPGIPAASRHGTARHGTPKHSTLSPLPHVPTAPGTARQRARCAGHWHRCAMSAQHQTQTRVWHLAQPHTRASARAGRCQPWHGRCPVPGHTPTVPSCQPLRPGFFRQIGKTLVPVVTLPQCPPRHCPGAHHDAAVPAMTLSQCPTWLGIFWLVAAGLPCPQPVLITLIGTVAKALRPSPP